MGAKTGIGWTESTLNLAWGCTKVSRECSNCYMYRVSPRFSYDPYKVVFTKPGKDEAIPERAAIYFTKKIVPENCWVGTSVGIKDAINRIDILRSIPAKIRFISFEPLLEDLGELNLKGIQWVIIGGESDYKNPRPMKPEWAENIIRQAQDQGVAPFFKQLGGIIKPGIHPAGGDLLNGRKIQEYPIR